MKALVKTISPLVRRDRVGSTLRVLLNLMTGWHCIGFCAGEDDKSQAVCHEICGRGRLGTSVSELNASK